MGNHHAADVSAVITFHSVGLCLQEEVATALISLATETLLNQTVFLKKCIFIFISQTVLECVN